jgi:hypothetical protein
VRRLLVELETGGNIRMEDGRPTDLWYKSCVDLLHSRFFKEDFAEHRVAGLRVVQVTRIHNRFLRNRFEEHLESMVYICHRARITPTQPRRKPRFPSTCHFNTTHNEQLFLFYILWLEQRSSHF